MPSGPRCGDKAEYEYEVSSELVGLFASVFVTRENTPGITANSQLEIKKEKTNIVWPDQEKEDGSYYGGRKFDPRGLDKKSYEEKFDEQKFKLDIMCLGEEKGSGDTIEIKAYDDKGPDQKTVGLPGEIERWEEYKDIDVKTGKLIPTAVYLQKKTYPVGTFEQDSNLNCGKFRIALKDGVVVITVKLCLMNTKPGDGPKIFKYMKKKVEGFWNSESHGFNQWVYHRQDCERKGDCSCIVVKDSKGNYLNAGCCKFPIKVILEEASSTNTDTLVNKIQVVYLDFMQRIQGLLAKIYYKFGWGMGMHTGMFLYPENRPNSYAHEVGHMMGFPDQYKTGHICQGAMSMVGSTNGGTFPIDKDSIMGATQQKARLEHIGASWFDEWINNALGEDADVMDYKK